MCAAVSGCLRVRIRKMSDGRFFAEFFTQTQVFHRNFNTEEFRSFTEKLPYTDGILWRQCLIINAHTEVSMLTSKKGKTTVLTKPKNTAAEKREKPFELNRRKSYIIAENNPVPFLTALGIMNADGKVFASKYAKFRQINRFLEYIDDILADLTAAGAGTERPLRIIDFGCGKSYLTFAIHYFLTGIKGLQADIIGLDLKADVIENCRTLAQNLNCRSVHFEVQDVRTYKADPQKTFDMVVSLHACDTATDYAIAFAVKHRSRVILSAPCCQHELNGKIGTERTDRALKALMSYGIIKERFSALATDVMRAELIKKHGYSVDICEFVDTEHTPKNLLIRAVSAAVRRKKKGAPRDAEQTADADTATDSAHAHAARTAQNDTGATAGAYEDLCTALGARITLEKLTELF